MVPMFLNYLIFALNKYLMKSLRLTILFFTCLCFSYFEAQQVTKSDTISGNVVTMSMDKNISDLLASNEDKCARTIANTDRSNSNNNNSYTAPRVVVPERAMSNAEVCRNNPRLMGFKIQIAVVKSNNEAKEVGLYFRRRFPNMKVEIDASLRPNYKVLAGSYFTKQSANSDYNSVRGVFKDARLVSYRIFCVEAK